MRKRPEVLVETVTEKLLIYALGRGLGVPDRSVFGVSFMRPHATITV